MKVNWNYIKAFALLVLVVFLYSFSSARNKRRNLERIEVHFTNDENLYITETAVNKLLIQKHDSVQNLAKETLDLKVIENRLDTDEMIEDAEVYLTVNGRLEAVISQRRPIARVYGNESYYIDVNGKHMPLSTNYSARVPFIKSIEEEHIPEVYPLVMKIDKDEFLKEHITLIKRNQKGEYVLEMRLYDFEILFGEANSIENKIKNLKAFYKKALLDNQLGTYKWVNLKFENQVVCTKKG
ncbi:cell division protein FtsQ/DivIB [Mesonia ostreae]|uniref:Cell division protein FtsQ n=1 Tax=Mesonia ostreae TaxID=861110 RepID=A0ABU2KF80_9FLAO|nr:hypothetical protein [Mesonia ostreae]MDT0293355.1 hypothetical protein [Mesonia ostreae]